MDGGGSTSDVKATQKQVSEAISKLSEADFFKIQRYAQKRTVVLRTIKGDQDWASEVTQEAITRILAGDKQWPINRIDFVTCIIQAIKNIAGHELRRILETIKDGEERFSEETAHEQSSLTGSIRAGTIEMHLAKDKMQEIKAKLEKEPPLKDLLEYRLAGFEPHEIRELLDVSENEFNAMTVKLKRRLKDELDEEI